MLRSRPPAIITPVLKTKNISVGPEPTFQLPAHVFISFIAEAVSARSLHSLPLLPPPTPTRGCQHVYSSSSFQSCCRPQFAGSGSKLRGQHQTAGPSFHLEALQPGSMPFNFPSLHRPRPLPPYVASTCHLSVAVMPQASALGLLLFSIFAPSPGISRIVVALNIRARPS